MRTKLTASLLTCLFVSSCGAHSGQQALQEALEAHTGEASVMLRVGDVYPTATEVLLVCPYAGHVANDALGRQVFGNLEDAQDANNWIVTEQPNGTVSKIKLERSQIDLCGGDSQPVLALSPDAQLEFEGRDGVWALQRR